MHILIAPNAFKNSLDADAASRAIEEGLKESELYCSTTRFPVADGGDGTAALLMNYLSAESITATVHDPLGRKLNSSFGIYNKKTAIIELADASGLRLLKPHEYNPLHASTIGTGELIAKALDHDVNKIILCVGGSATVDGGIGIMHALGIKLFDEHGEELSAQPVSLQFLSRIDMPASGGIPQHIEFVVLCDVENVLLGSSGAAAMFGPQKGASDEQVQYLDRALERFNEITLKTTGKDMASLKHGGAAGGVAAAMHAFFNARLVNGIDYFLGITNFEKQLSKADIVITGEGSLDEQTLQGKGPYGVAQKAKQYGVPVIAMAGRISAEKKLRNFFDALICINDKEQDISFQLANTGPSLRTTSRNLGNAITRGMSWK
jgi:glycerate 2-kinase